MSTPSGIPDKLWQPPYAVLETTMGEIVIELYWKHAPSTCRNFAELVRRSYYNGTKFHRIIRDFMIQGGDPTGTGKGGTSIYGRHFDDEIHEELKHTGAGIISMANSGPDTNGSQFFITLAPTQWLDGKHAIFGDEGNTIDEASSPALSPLTSWPEVERPTCITGTEALDKISWVTCKRR